MFSLYFEFSVTGNALSIPFTIKFGYQKPITPLGINFTLNLMNGLITTHIVRMALAHLIKSTRIGIDKYGRMSVEKSGTNIGYEYCDRLSNKKLQIRWPEKADKFILG
jgi:hypothetical protein